MNQWAVKYIGLPHQIGGRGPLFYDCWGLILRIYKDEFGIELPPLPGVAASGLLELLNTIYREMDDQWTQIAAPFSGCGVGMGRRNTTHHAGLFVSEEGGKVLHCWAGPGVILDSVRSIRLKGFSSVRFYQHRLWPHIS